MCGRSRWLTTITFKNYELARHRRDFIGNHRHKQNHWHYHHHHHQKVSVFLVFLYVFSLNIWFRFCSSFSVSVRFPDSRYQRRWTKMFDKMSTVKAALNAMHCCVEVVSVGRDIGSRRKTGNAAVCLDQLLYTSKLAPWQQRRLAAARRSSISTPPRPRIISSLTRRRSSQLSSRLPRIANCPSVGARGPRHVLLLVTDKQLHAVRCAILYSTGGLMNK